MQTIDGIIFQRKGRRPPFALVMSSSGAVYRPNDGDAITKFLDENGSPRLVLVVYVDNLEDAQVAYLEMTRSEGWMGDVAGPFDMTAVSAEDWKLVFADPNERN